MTPIEPIAMSSGEVYCRCGHLRDDHSSRSEQGPKGEKRYVQKCEHCPCETFVDKDGPMSRMIDGFHGEECQEMSEHIDEYLRRNELHATAVGAYAAAQAALARLDTQQRSPKWLRWLLQEMVEKGQRVARELAVHRDEVKL